SLDTPTSYHLVASFLAYPAGFGGGVNVSAADLNGDGVDDIVTGAGPGGGPHVEVWDGASLLKGRAVLLKQFYAYDPAFTGGVFVAAGEFQSPIYRGPYANIVVAAGPGGPQEVHLINGHRQNYGAPVFRVTPYPGFGGGISIAVTQDNQTANTFLV